ncbi:MAG TPA: CheR family methyltransferase, partial [Pseudoxanthomonas sp.]|nr:CheR family methyltransferase [Pseudoxanthomonas sp.]
MIAKAKAPDAVRVWTAGCASGEEAYSLAMLLCDGASRQPEPPGVQVFATDIDDRAIARARAAAYPDSIITDVPPMRLREYFTRDKNHYRIKKSLRDKVMFAAHNVLRDPPFSRMDLISCRNLLIYLDRDIQHRLLQTFHFALKPGGYLFLGSSESVDAASPYFDLVDKRHRIFRARGRSHASAHMPMLPLRVGSIGLPKAQPAQAAGSAMFDVHQRALQAFSPPSLIVDSDYNVLHVSADAGRFLRFSTGEPTHNLLKVIEPALRVELRTALFQAVTTGKEAEAIRVKVDEGSAQGVFNLSVRPFKDPETSADYLLVIFSEVKEGPVEEAIRVSAPGAERVIAHLEDELQRTRDRLQSTVEQSETSTEELKASNEELQAINEELRSATEELETSKEELQSVNEELTTVNHELKSKVEEAAQINDDLRNFIASTEIATVFIDAEWRIKRYTPSAEDIFSIIPSDVGRKLLDITHRLDYPELSGDIEAAYQLLVPRQREVKAQGGRLYMARVLPYRTGENRIDGAVLTFVDITALRQAEERAQRASPGGGERWGLVVTDDDGTITGWSSGMTALLGFVAADAIGQPLARLLGPQAGTAETGGTTRRYLRRDGGIWSGCGTSVKLQGQLGAAELLWEPTSQPLEQGSREEGRLLSEAMAASSLRDEFLAVMSHELKHPLNLIGINSEILARLPEVRHSSDAARVVETLRRAVRSQAKIIDDLLDLSRMRTGKLRLNLYPVNVAELVTTIAESAKADVSASELELDLDADEPVIVCGDAQRI